MRNKKIKCAEQQNVFGFSFLPHFGFDVFVLNQLCAGIISARLRRGLHSGWMWAQRPDVAVLKIAWPWSPRSGHRITSAIIMKGYVHRQRMRYVCFDICLLEIKCVSLGPSPAPLNTYNHTMTWSRSVCACACVCPSWCLV